MTKIPTLSIIHNLGSNLDNDLVIKSKHSFRDSRWWSNTIVEQNAQKGLFEYFKDFWCCILNSVKTQKTIQFFNDVCLKKPEKLWFEDKQMSQSLLPNSFMCYPEL